MEAIGALEPRPTARSSGPVNAVIDKIASNGKSTLAGQLPVIRPLGFLDRIGIGVADDIDHLAGILFLYDGKHMTQALALLELGLA